MSRRFRPFRRVALLLPALALACAPPETWTENGPRAAGIECNPIADDWDCMMPYPSDFYRKKVTPTSRLPGGFAIELPDKAKVLNHSVQGEPVPFDFFRMFPSDGFSAVPQIGIKLPVAVDMEPLVFHTDDLGESLEPTSRTLLIDAETGEAQPHFAEYDMRPPEPDRALVIRPVRRLQNGRRYVVVLQKLTQPGGAAIPSPAGFAKIRDGKADSPVLSRLVDYYGARIFPVTAKFGVAKADLTLAWDFTVQSWDNVSGDLLRVRELAMRSMEATPPEVTQISFRDYAPGVGDGEHWGRKVVGKIKVPLFTVAGIPDSQRTADTTSDEDDDSAGSLLHRDADGRVTQNGYTDVDFTLIIPRSVYDATKPRPARVLQYGHGFFGDRGELQGFASRFADETGMIVMGVDWMGMSTIDAAVVLGDLLGEPEQSMRFIERTHQGIMNFMALTYALRTTFAEQAALKVGGELVYDPAAAPFYYGISQGHIMGTTYLSMSPHIERAALQVGGASFGFMMSRSRNFIQFLDPIESTVQGAGNAFRLVMLLQSAIDRVDPITYTPHLLKDTFPGSPARRSAILETGIGDAQVPNLATHLQVRTLGIPELAPAPRKIWGIEQSATPGDSAWVEYDFNVQTFPEARQVEDDNVVHEGIRRTRASIERLDAFLRKDGVLTNTCVSHVTGQPAACLCSDVAEHSCNPATCSSADDACDGNALLRCNASRTSRVRTACANGCDPDAKACRP
jgi:hypothetical protein